MRHKDVSDLTAPCGFFCCSCYFYVDEQCPGCIPLNEARKKAGVRVCRLYECSRIDKKVGFCSLCEKFPCELSYSVIEVLRRHMEKVRKGERLRKEEGSLEVWESGEERG